MWGFFYPQSEAIEYSYSWALLSVGDVEIGFTEDWLKRSIDVEQG